MKEVLYKFRGAEYIVCSDGRILSTKNIGRGGFRKELKQRIDADGYPVITVGDNKHRTVKKVHRIIAESFIPNPDNLPEVDHIDNNKQNNDVSNLRWITGFENKSRIPFETRSMSHRHEKNGRATVTIEVVRQIREKFKLGKTIEELVIEFNSNNAIISNIVKNRTWKGI